MLSEVGRWMDTNGERSINPTYATAPLELRLLYTDRQHALYACALLARLRCCDIGTDGEGEIRISAEGNGRWRLRRTLIGCI